MRLEAEKRLEEEIQGVLVPLAGDVSADVHLPGERAEAPRGLHGQSFVLEGDDGAGELPPAREIGLQRTGGEQVSVPSMDRAILDLGDTVGSQLTEHLDGRDPLGQVKPQVGDLCLLSARPRVPAEQTLPHGHLAPKQGGDLLAALDPLHLRPLGVPSPDVEPERVHRYQGLEAALNLPPPHGGDPVLDKGEEALGPERVPVIGLGRLQVLDKERVLPPAALLPRHVALPGAHALEQHLEVLLGGGRVRRGRVD